MKNKPSRILVTAGDTYELIDEVRRVTHMGTGRLGSLIADEFIRQGAEVTYLCGETSMRPTEKVRKTVEITGVMELLKAMDELLDEEKYDALIHSMAVSDYTVRGVTTEQDLVGELEKEITQMDNPCQLRSTIEHAIRQAQYLADGKLSSDLETLTVFMARAPKVISIVKQKQPNILLVGFKLLVGVTESELINAAKRQMQNSGSDFVLANDLDTIQGDEHCGILIDETGIIDRPKTKPDIASSIARAVLTKIQGNQGDQGDQENESSR